MCAKRNLSILQTQATSSSLAFMPRPSISHKQPPMQHQIEIGYHHLDHRPMPEHVTEHMSGVPRPAAKRQHTVLRLCQDEAPCWNAKLISKTRRELFRTLLVALLRVLVRLLRVLGRSRGIPQLLHLAWLGFILHNTCV